MVRKNFKNVCMFVFFLNLGRRYHIKYKAEMLHNTEKHKNNDSRGEFQN